MRRRAEVLEIAVLGLLHQAPLHGYELRKRINLVLGSFHALSFGSLYPALKDMELRALIEARDAGPLAGPALAGRRGRIVYTLTPLGEDHLQAQLDSAGPDAWEDERFSVHLTFFGRVDAATRLRVLEGRRARLQERLAKVQASIDAASRQQVDRYGMAVQQHGLDQVRSEVQWVEHLIRTEREGS